MNSKSHSVWRWVLGAALAFLPFAGQAFAEDEFAGANAVTAEIEPYQRVYPTVSAGLDIQYSPIAFPNYQWSDGHLDPKSGHGVRIALEWLAISETYGKLGFGVGVGLYDISKVRLQNGALGELQALPIEPAVSYRFDYVRSQILVPFVKIGPEITVLKDKTLPGKTVYYGLNYTVGLQLCLDRIDKSAYNGLNHTYGVRHSYLVGEYVKNTFLGRDQGPDLTRDEWRVGLRFEL